VTIWGDAASSVSICSVLHDLGSIRHPGPDFVLFIEQDHAHQWRVALCPRARSDSHSRWLLSALQGFSVGGPIDPAIGSAQPATPQQRRLEVNGGFRLQPSATRQRLKGYD
jgi:hypothetical protein